MWLLAGILIGLGLAWYLAARGLIPQPRPEQPVANDTAAGQHDDTVFTDEVSKAADKHGKPRYDFFTVLPEMEVVVPEQELSQQRAPAGTANAGGDSDAYLLQVGSFMSAADADALKARLALNGFVATVQSVTVNDATWHRVRVGPVRGLRQADEIRQRLQDNGIVSLVMKIPAKD